MPIDIFKGLFFLNQRKISLQEDENSVEKIQWQNTFSQAECWTALEGEQNQQQGEKCLCVLFQ